MEKIQSCRRVLGSIAGLDRLHVSLQLIEKSLISMVGLQHGTGTGDHCLLQLKDTIYEADDVLDEMEYEILKSGSHASSRKEVRTASSSSRIEQSSSYMDNFLGKLHVLVQKVEHMSKNTALTTSEGNGSSQQWIRAPVSQVLPSLAIATHVLEEQKLYGRHKEKEDLVAVLTDSGDHRQHLPMVAVIAGMGGIGKTALARAICHDSRVAQHFDKIIWTCLPRIFDATEITREILRSALADKASKSIHGSSASLDQLQRELQGVVASSKLLLVIDGVWNDERRSHKWHVEEWRAILAPFRAAKQSSKILVTTRARMVSESLHASLLYSLDMLKSTDCRQLLKDQILQGCSPTATPEEADHIGRIVLDRAKGLPLAVVAMGQLLEKSKKSAAEWKQTLNADIHGLDDAVLPSLKMSYEYLAPHLQRCFAYCSLFPKGFKLDRERLVQQWIAHDFVRLSTETAGTMEDVGREYFDHLVSCSFFQPLNKGDQTLYTMHDLMHDLARFVSADDCLLVEDHMPHIIPPTIRHLSTTMGNLGELKAIHNLHNIRTLIIFGKPAVGKQAAQQRLQLYTNLPKMKKIRVLDVASFGAAQPPNTISKLIHLRYLALSTCTDKLPPIANLLFLQTLILPHGNSLEELPGGIKMLTNLRHFHMDSKYSATIQEIGQLTSLQELDEFVVRKEHTDKSNIEELRHLNSLHGRLCIKNLNDIQSIEEARNAQLQKKQHLTTLSLEWSAAAASSTKFATKDAQVLETLKPPSNLEVLHIARYPAMSPPTWFTLRRLRNLKSLFLTNCRSLQVLPTLGQIPFLQNLHMKELCSLDHIGEEFYGADDVVFPSLKVLELDDMPKLAKWQNGEMHNHIAFPRLKRLTLSNCPKLVQMPPFPPTATTIMIHHTGLIPDMRFNLAPSSKSKIYTLEACTTTVLNSGLFAPQHLQAVVNFNFSCNKQKPVLAEELQVLSSLQRLTMSHCGLSNEKLSMCLQALPISLSSLEIVDLHNITALPLHSFSYVRNLHELTIRNCLVLSSLSFLESFISLKCLIIERCPRLTETSFSYLRSLPSLKMLTILHCQELRSLPISSLPSSLESVRLIGCHPNLHKQLGLEAETRCLNMTGSILELGITSA